MPPNLSDWPLAWLARNKKKEKELMGVSKQPHVDHHKETREEASKAGLWIDFPAEPYVETLSTGRGIHRPCQGELSWAKAVPSSWAT
jgi:hypothetical protein